MVEYVAYAAFAYVIGRIAAHMMRPDPEQPVLETKPATLSVRGAVVPLLIGHRRVGAVIGWVGDRVVETEQASSGGKGSSGSSVDQTVYFEGAWHHLVIGPGREIRKCWMNGKVIWSGKLTPENSPSGTWHTFDDHEGEFAIFWGHSRQPVNTDLGKASRVGVTSRWPHLMYVQIRRFRLGGFAVWPLLEWEVYVHPFREGDDGTATWDDLPERLSSSAGWYRNGIGAFDNGQPILEVQSGDNPWIKIADDSPAGYFWDLLWRFAVEAKIKDQPFGRANGNWVVAQADFNAAETIYALNETYADATGYDRNMDDIAQWSRLHGAQAPTVVTGSGFPPPPPGEPTGGSSNDRYVWHTLVDLGRTEHDMTGGGNKFSPGRTRLLFWVHGLGQADPYGLGYDGSTELWAGFTSSATSSGHSVRFIWNGSAIEVDIEDNGAIGTVVQSGSGWWKLSVEYTAGAGSSPSDETDDRGIAFEWSPPNTSLAIYPWIDPSPSEDYFVGDDDGSIVTGVTTIFLGQPIPDLAPHEGTIIARLVGYGEQGPNAGHLLHQLLFAEWPHGAGLDESKFDVSGSMEDFGILIGDQDEGLRTHVLAQGGQNLDGVVAGILQDCGVMIAWSVVEGLYQFQPVRKVVVEDAAQAFFFLPSSDTPPYTVTVGSRTFTVKSGLTASGDVRWDSDHDKTIRNLQAAITGGGGRGILYHEDTPAHEKVTAALAYGLGSETLTVEALGAGTGGNSIGVSASVGTWEYPLGSGTATTLLQGGSGDAGQVLRVPSDSLMDPLPEVRTRHSIRTVTAIIYSFPAVGFAYRPNTVRVMDDSTARERKTQVRRQIGLTTVIDSESAVKVAERRSQEEIAAPTLYRINGKNETRKLQPGDTFIVEGLEADGIGDREVLRVLSVKPETGSGRTRVEVVTDVYGVTLSAFEEGVTSAGSSDDEGAIPPVQPIDDTFVVHEVSAFLSPTKPAIWVPRIRGSRDTTRAEVHLSVDGGHTYRRLGSEATYVAGGHLIDDMDDQGWLIEEGPRFQELSEDTEGIVQTLEADDWAAGRQIALIEGDAGLEMFYLRAVTAEGGGVWRLRGLRRGRFEFGRQTHPANKLVFIFPAERLTPWFDSALSPGREAIVKVQPVAGTAKSLAAARSNEVAILGRAHLPLPPTNLRTENLTQDYRTGESPAIRWGYLNRFGRMERSGYGFQKYGEALSRKPQVEGEFVVKIKDGASVKRTVRTGRTSFLYRNSDLVADLGSEKTFTVEVTLEWNGRASAVQSITVTFQS